MNRVDVAFERRARAERDHGQARRGADFQDRRDFVGRVREADHIRCGRSVVRLAVAVMLADGGRVVRARAEELLERVDGLLDRWGAGWRAHQS